MSSSGPGAAPSSTYDIAALKGKQIWVMNVGSAPRADFMVTAE
jgi:hypothetical protein